MEQKTSDAEPRRATRTKKLLAALAAVSAIVALAACGGSDSSDDTSTAAAAEGATGSSASATSDRAVKYSQCMRENGVTNFPDPENGRLTLRAGPGSGVDPNSSTFKSAQKACQSLAPSGGGTGGNEAVQEGALKFAECMRKNGVPDFPDPEVDGGRVLMSPGAGVDPNSAAFQKAQSKCSDLLSGGAQGTTP